MILFLLKLLFVYPFKILDTVTPVFPKVLQLCDGIDERLFDVSVKVCEQLQESGYDVLLGSNEPTGSICNEKHDRYYGYMLPYTNFTEIYISNELLDKPNTLYNVLLHEVLHSVGLDHSTNEGMMKYAITETYWGNIVDDQRKLWPSVDDLTGLYYLKHLHNLV